MAVKKRAKAQSRRKKSVARKQRAIQSKWETGEDVPVEYANQVFVSHAGGEFYLVFGQLVSPHVSTPEPDAKELPDFIPIKPVARLAIAPAAMVRILQALQSNVERFAQTLEQKE